MSRRRISPGSRTDWPRLDRLKDRDIDLSEIPEIPPGMFARAIVRKGLEPPARKAQLTLRLDSDVLAWFRRQGQGYQTRINAILKAYMEAHDRRALSR